MRLATSVHSFIGVQDSRLSQLRDTRKVPENLQLEVIELQKDLILKYDR